MPEDESKARVLVEVNAGIREFAAASSSSAVEWEFFCECGDPACHEVVSLTIATYEATRDAGNDILAPGHTTSPRAHSRRLLEDAKALREQAAHQLRRAQRNLERNR